MRTVQSSCVDSSSQSTQSEVFLLSQVTKRFHTETLHQDSLLTSRRAGGCADAHRLWQDQSLAACADSCVHHIQTSRALRSCNSHQLVQEARAKQERGLPKKQVSVAGSREVFTLHCTADEVAKNCQQRGLIPRKVTEERVSAYIPPSLLSCSRSSLSIVTIEAD